MNPLPVLKKGAVVVVALLLVSGLVVGGLLATGVVEVQQPTVESVDTEWGTVTDSESAIRTEVVVNNPNPAGLPGVLNIDYEASMNTVTLASGEKSGVGLSTGENTIGLEASIPNDRIADWWVTHINNDERSQLSISGTVSGPAGISKDISRDRTIETNILSGLTTDGQKVVSANGEKFLVMSEQTASWGEATDERTPLTFSTTVENVHDYDVTLDGMSYVVTMNNVTVGEGTTTQGVDVQPGERSEVSVTAALNTSKIADWWSTHVRAGEQTNISVSVYGYVEENGERKRVPLEIMDREMALQTDILGDGSTSVETIESPDEGPDVAQPTVQGTEREWGQVTDATTEVRSTIDVDNPNTGTINDLLLVTVGQQVTINDVLVADGETTFDGLAAGDNALVHAAELDNSKVPEWWARHVNDGEQSTVRIQPSATADVQFTRFDVPLDERTNTVSTDMLAGVESDEKRSFDVEGRQVGVIHSQSAEWGQATTERTPFTVSVTIENTGRVPISIGQLQYNVDMNDVTTGNGTAPESYTIQPGQTRTVTFTLALDSQRMDEWWVSHIRNGEETVVDFDAVATVSAGTESRQLRLTPKGPEDTVTTNFLNTSSALVTATTAPDAGYWAV